MNSNIPNYSTVTTDHIIQCAEFAVTLAIATGDISLSVYDAFEHLTGEILKDLEAQELYEKCAEFKKYRDVEMQRLKEAQEAVQ